MARNTARHRGRKRPTAEAQAYLHPVGRAVFLRQIESNLREISIELYMRTPAQPCPDFLAMLAWMLGVGSELACQALGRHHVTARMLHGALRSVMQLCATGYRWQPELAPAIQAAISHSHQLLLHHEREALRHIPDANWLSNRIRTRTVDGTEVAGAEVYAQQPTQQPTQQTDKEPA